MGITKLMHMKESTPQPYIHLKNSIQYILNPEKTNQGELVGGTAGISANEILETFLNTKRFYGKEDGRQGYHFVISFEKGTADEATAYRVVQEFCEEYLGDNYEHVLAIHNDKDHMHGHIIFNSVSRSTGYKYRYEKGDWEKYIQPVTDKICERHGLKPLVFESEKVGVSYAAWASKKENGYDWQDIIRADIDVAAQRTFSFEGFKQELLKMGYTIGRCGKRNGEEYISLKAPGMGRAWRTTSLGREYSLTRIKERIGRKDGPAAFEKITALMVERTAYYIFPANIQKSQIHRRLYQAVNFYQLPNPYAVSGYQVRKDMLELQRLIDTCAYLDRTGLSAGNLSTRLEEVQSQLSLVRTQKFTLSSLQKGMTEEERDAQHRYVEIRKRLSAPDISDMDFEKLDDEQRELQNQYQEDVLNLPARKTSLEREEALLKKEKKILKTLIDENEYTSALEPTKHASIKRGK